MPERPENSTQVSDDKMTVIEILHADSSDVAVHPSPGGAERMVVEFKRPLTMRKALGHLIAEWEGLVAEDLNDDYWQVIGLTVHLAPEPADDTEPSE